MGHVAAKVMQETGANASFVKSMEDAKAAEGVKGRVGRQGGPSSR